MPPPNLPDDERNPYGDFTHASGAYRFEWTPFTPAVVAWRNAEGLLRRAAANLADARRLPGFAINGLGAEHDRMMESLAVFLADTEATVQEAGVVAQLLEAANNDYARNNEASREEYHRLMTVLQGELRTRYDRRHAADAQEAEAEHQRDIDPNLAPLDPPPVPVDPLEVVENWRTSGRGSY